MRAVGPEHLARMRAAGMRPRTRSAAPPAAAPPQGRRSTATSAIPSRPPRPRRPIPAKSAEQRAWHAADVGQRHLDNARALWARAVERNRREVEEKSEALKVLANMAALVAGFSMAAFMQARPCRGAGAGGARGAGRGGCSAGAAPAACGAWKARAAVAGRPGGAQRSTRRAPKRSTRHATLPVAAAFAWHGPRATALCRILRRSLTGVGFMTPAAWCCLCLAPPWHSPSRLTWSRSSYAPSCWSGVLHGWGEGGQG